MLGRVLSASTNKNLLPPLLSFWEKKKKKKNPNGKEAEGAAAAIAGSPLKRQISIEDLGI